MSSSQSAASEQALQSNKALAQGYYNIALPALQGRLGSINTSLGQGEPTYLQQAYQGQRAGLTEGLAAQGGQAEAQLQRGSKKATEGGNPFASLNPADIGAQLANALYGSKFQEGQANLGQQFNLISMGLGGAGTTGNAALQASQNQLGAIGYLPQYNTTYANVMGGLAGAASLYGAYNQWAANQPAAGFMGTNYAAAMPGLAASQWGGGGYSGLGLAPSALGGAGIWGIPQASPGFGLGNVSLGGG
jgi:hypothetical protein